MYTLVLTTLVIFLAATGTVADAASYSSVRSGNWSQNTNGSTASPWITTVPANYVYPWQAQAISGAANNGSGLIRIQLATSPTPAWVSGDAVFIAGVTGTTEANAPGGTIVSPRWVVAYVDGTHFDLMLPFVTATATSGTATRASDSYGSTVKTVANNGSGAVRLTHRARLVAGGVRRPLRPAPDLHRVDREGRAKSLARQH